MSEESSFWAFWEPLLLPVLIVFTVYRLTRLTVKDTFPPVLWLRDRLAGGWRPMTDAEWRYRVSPEYLKIPVEQRWQTTSDMGDREHLWVHRAPWSPDWLAELITCPWCASGWITGAVIAVTDVTYGLPVPWVYGPAVWGAAALLASQEWA